MNYRPLLTLFAGSSAAVSQKGSS